MTDATSHRTGRALTATVAGTFLAGVSTTGAAVVASYGGMWGSVRCDDPNAALCTGLSYGYGLPGFVPAALAVAGLAVAAAGLRALTRTSTR